MRSSSRTDEDLLGATDAASFEEFYLRHVDMVIGYYQAVAVRARVVDERGYGEIAGELHTSEAVVRNRVSRGLATARRRIGRTG